MVPSAEATDFTPAPPQAVENFIERWKNAGGSERANYQLFLTELCGLLGLPQPDPAGDETANNAYVFERRVDVNNPDGSLNRGYIDLYKRGCFVLEAKQTGVSLDSDVWDKAMLRAQSQADKYVRSLPVEESRPPFIIVTDVGRSIELYAEFSRSGGTYVPFPDPRHYRIRLEDLGNPDIQRRLYLLWHKPEALDPSRYAARVTKAISAKLAELARSLEQQGYDVQRVAHFIKRCLFTMFSEDVGLLPQESFTQLLVAQKRNPDNFVDALRALWESMNSGGYSAVLNERIRQFNGGLFRGIDPIPLKADQIQLLIDAAKADWRLVEPAIFGTLLERALDPRERHKLGAHYTPRAYVERLVMPTIIEPLREQWRGVQVAAEAWLQKGKPDKAVDELRQFHFQLCQTRILDPACGSGNFLYVSLEHMKRLEGEVLNLISDLTAGQVSFDTQGLTVDPHQFLGLEINPRAAAIAELVLWIGYLQWHYRIHKSLNLPEPILRDFHNIEFRDALIEYDSREPMLDEQGKPVTRWDGRTTKPHPVTGKEVPDETARDVVYRYHNPRQSEWPEADYVVGNPPFIGNKRMRFALGDGYAESLRNTYPNVPETADFVMYWWHRAANLTREGKLRRFGFIATNSLRQTFNRRVTQYHMDQKKPLSLLYAVPDHPWVDAADGAAVRISMSVGTAGDQPGTVELVSAEHDWGGEGKEVDTRKQTGKIYPDLRIGANVAGAKQLISNSSICYQGYVLVGEGFVITAEDVERFQRLEPTAIQFIKPWRNGRDILQTNRGLFVIDFFPLTEQEARSQSPILYQHLLHSVKPFREQVARKGHREKWWIWGEARPGLRRAVDNLDEIIITNFAAKHRLFVLGTPSTAIDHNMYIIASNDWALYGVLQSRLHVCWMLHAGSTLENRPLWINSTCFLPFPFPNRTPEHNRRLQDLAEQIDTHRKRQQISHPNLTLTGMYNVLEKLRAGNELTANERIIHEEGLVSVLKELHDDLDQAVFDAYGWNDLAVKLVGKPGATTPLPDKLAEQAAAEEELLTRLVALNAQRAAEEAQGQIRWLRPEYQSPETIQRGAELGLEAVKNIVAPAPVGKQAWPKTIPEQVTAIRDLLQKGPRSLDAVADQFKRKPQKGVEQVLAAMQVLGHVEVDDGMWKLV